jgi:hypothetical protein
MSPPIYPLQGSYHDIEVKNLIAALLKTLSWLLMK